MAHIAIDGHKEGYTSHGNRTLKIIVGKNKKIQGENNFSNLRRIEGFLGCRFWLV